MMNTTMRQFQSPRPGKFVSNDVQFFERRGDRWVAFQSPRSGKFVSDVPNWCENRLKIEANTFQSPKSGKFVSDLGDTISLERYNAQKFQSPRSGKFVSDFQLFRLCF